MSLLIRVPCHMDEAYAGYLLRLSEENAFHGLAGLAKTFQLGRGALSVAEQEQEPLWRCLGLAWPASNPKQPLRAPPHADRTMQRRSIRRYGWTTRNAWCPVCLQQQAYWQSGWESLITPACVVHCVRLCRACDQCGKAVDWNRPHLLRCACGRDLRRAPLLAATEGEIACSRAASGAHLSGFSLIQQIGSLPVFDQWLATAFLADILGCEDWQPRSNIDRVSALASAPQAEGFFSSPDETVIRRLPLFVRTKSFNRRYREIDLMRLPKFLSERLTQLKSESRPAWIQTRGMFSVDLADRASRRGFTTISDLMLLFGGQKRIWRELCKRGVIRGAYQKTIGGERSWVLPLGAINEFVAFFQSTLSAEEAAGRLRAMPWQIDVLDKLGLLRPVSKSSRRLFRRYEVAEVDRVIERFKQIALASSLSLSTSTDSHSVPLLDSISAARSDAAFRSWKRKVSSVLLGRHALRIVADPAIEGLKAFAVST